LSQKARFPGLDHTHRPQKLRLVIESESEELDSAGRATSATVQLTEPERSFNRHARAALPVFGQVAVTDYFLQ